MAIFRKESDGDSIKPAAFNVPRPLTAAAVQVKLNDKGEAELFKDRKNSADAQWQSEAWEYYDAIGEIKYSFQLVANIVSRIRLYPAVVNDASEAPVGVDLSPDFDPKLAEAAQRALSRLDSAYGGQAGLLRDAALNLSVTGECYLVQVPERIGSGLPETWDIRSVDELHQDNSGQFYVNSRRQKSGSSFSGGAPSSNIIPLPVGSFMGRIWRSHPRYSDEPDSSLRGILDLCEELLLLNRTFRATAKSRLNAGALYIPDGLSASNGIDPDMVGADEDGIFPEEAADEFEEQLIDAMTTPVTDESSASAVVPLIIRGPADLGDKIKQFKFERSFDAELAKRSDRVLERILQGLDIPKDVVTGLASVKYSNAVQIDESLYKAHIEPLLLLISDALTVVYLRPYLRGIGFSELEVSKVVVWYDPSSVATRNDRASDADSGFDKLAISSQTWRRAHGFSETDAPDPTELALRLLTQRASFTPELTEALLTAIAPELIASARAASQASSVAPVPANIAEALAGEVPSAEPAEGVDSAVAPPESSDPVEPGEDAPPFPLAEPKV
jgi:hypothetical protein